jgi:phosphate butyryltransferase
VLKNFDELLAKVKATPGKRVVIAAAQTGSALEAAVLARKDGLADSLLTGDEAYIRQHLREKFPQFADAFEIIDTGADMAAACSAAVQSVIDGRAHLILKGKCDSGTMMKAVLNKENGLRTGEVVSDVLAFETPERITLLTDGGVILYPDLNEKISLINNSVKVAKALGAELPKVALLAAVETVNPKMPCTLDAAELTLMNRRGQIRNCIVDGPLALDNAISPYAAKLKGIESEVGGQADILVVPNIEAGNILGKAITYYCKWRVAHVVMGAKAPVLIASRADDAETKMLSMALGILCA